MVFLRVFYSEDSYVIIGEPTAVEGIRLCLIAPKITISQLLQDLYKSIQRMCKFFKFLLIVLLFPLILFVMLLGILIAIILFPCWCIGCVRDFLNAEFFLFT